MEKAKRYFKRGMVMTALGVAGTIGALLYTDHLQGETDEDATSVGAPLTCVSALRHNFDDKDGAASEIAKNCRDVASGTIDDLSESVTSEQTVITFVGNPAVALGVIGVISVCVGINEANKNTPPKNPFAQ